MDRSRRHHLRAGALFLGACALPGAQAQGRALMQALPWQPADDLADWWVSEKFDGMRGYWDGRALWSRSGRPIAAPAWFTAGWPAQPLDGELWAGRGRFETTVSTVRRSQPPDAAWRGIRFMAFDLPDHGGPFDERHEALARLLGSVNLAWLQAVAQSRVASRQDLAQRLAQVIAEGGEGLILAHGQAHYVAGRSAGLRKLKPEDDAEARVLAHLPGTGRLAGQVGALLVEMPAQDGFGARRFKLGTGLGEAERRQPPPVGAWVSFRHRGLTEAGLPRFASYWRLRPEE